jgi:hypothetical protein
MTAGCNGSDGTIKKGTTGCADQLCSSGPMMKKASLVERDCRPESM